MFEMINEDLEDCLELLRLMSMCETKNELLMLMAEHRIDESDVKRTIDLCEMMVYYNDKRKVR